MAFTAGEVAVPRRFISAGRAEVSFSVWRSLSLARRGPNRVNARGRGEKRREENGRESRKAGRVAKNKSELSSLNIRWKLRFARTQTRKTRESVSSSSPVNFFPTARKGRD